jgi:hypothetical protein
MSGDTSRAVGVIIGRVSRTRLAFTPRMNTPGGGSFRVNYGPGSAFAPSLIVLSAFQSSTSGDFDVDGNDFLVWQRGSPQPNSAADLGEWRGNFGFAGLTADGTRIPEPNTQSLTLGLALFALRTR